MKSRLLLILAVLALTLAACRPNPQPIRLQGKAQGTYYNIAYYDTQQRNLQPLVDSLLQRFDMTASLWVDSSLLRRINRHDDSIVTPLFRDLLEKSWHIHRYTGGAFDCEIGGLVNLYGFGFRNRADITDAQVDSLLAMVRQRSTRLDCQPDSTGDTLCLLSKLPSVEIDFNAIAQGYSVDLIAHLFDSLGLENYLIDVGGEIIARGRKADGRPWRVGIERPAPTADSPQEIETAIALCDQSVVTSGNYRKYYERDGMRYSHTIDPSTGRPVSHSLLSVSVVSRQAWYADAMATAFMVMGMERAIQFIHDHPENPDIQGAYFIYDDHGEYRTFATPAFEALINK